MCQRSLSKIASSVGSSCQVEGLVRVPWIVVCAPGFNVTGWMRDGNQEDDEIEESGYKTQERVRAL